MRTWTALMAAGAMGGLICSASVFGQGKPACDAQGKMKTAEKVEGQVQKVDLAHGKLTVLETDGTVHEFQASAETLQDLKVGDRIEAKLREVPKCP